MWWLQADMAGVGMKSLEIKRMRRGLAALNDDDVRALLCTKMNIAGD